MDPRLLRYYNRELQHVRDLGEEFANEYPKVAGRLGIEKEKVADPYVERLLEGFAFLAARVHLKMDDEFPNFTQHLLQLVFPHFLGPLPSMAIAQFVPVPDESALAEGYCIERDTPLQAVRGRGQKTTCEFRTGQSVTLWPIEVTEAKYFGSSGALATAHVPVDRGTQAGIRLRLRTTGGVAFNELNLDSLRFHLMGGDSLSARLYEQILGQSHAVVVRPKGGAAQWHHKLDQSAIKAVGFEPDESLLPFAERSFDGYRILTEYFAFPERFRFVDVTGLQSAVRQCASTELEIVFLFNRRDGELENRVSAQNFALNCTPVINLFPKRADRIHLRDRDHEYHVVPDLTRPLDFEVWSVDLIQGFGSGAAPEQVFHPLYSHRATPLDGGSAYFSLRRMPRVLTTRERQKGKRSSYVGSEVFVSVVDTDTGGIAPHLRQLEATTLCTNRDLPLHIPTGQGPTDFTLDSGAPVEAIRCVAGPTRPAPSKAHGDVAWRLIEHLSLNYLSLLDSEDGSGAAALRTLLSLYAEDNDQANKRQVDGLKSIRARTVNRRLPVSGPIAFGRGLEVTLQCEEGAFEGVGVFLFGQVLEGFLSKYVSINSFTETVLETVERGPVHRWPARIGQRQVL